MRKLTKKYSNSFLKNGYLIINSENNGSIEWIKNLIINTIKKKVKKFDGELNNLHKFVSIKKLNKIRMSVYDTINKNTELKKKYFSVCNNVIDELVGNELAIQKKINISFQLPKDNSSLLSLHSDVWSGDSPYEIVVWIPMVDVYRTKSMYILPQKKYRKFLNTLKKLKNKSSNQLYKKLKNDFIWLNLKFGQILIFNQTLPHGNVINEEKTSRISLNCRFKGLFTPYGTKTLGDFFEPFSMKVISKIGTNYKLPKL